MPDTPGQRSAFRLDQIDAINSGQQDVPNAAGSPSLAERVYHAHLTELVAAPDLNGLEKFILDVFNAEPRLVSDRHKQSLAHQLLVWASSQNKEIRNRVWISFGACNWILPLLELVGKLTKVERSAVLDVDPAVMLKVIGPYFSDQPRKIRPQGPYFREEPMDSG